LFGRRKTHLPELGTERREQERDEGENVGNQNHSFVSTEDRIEEPRQDQGELERVGKNGRVAKKNVLSIS